MTDKKNQVSYYNHSSNLGWKSMKSASNSNWAHSSLYFNSNANKIAQKLKHYAFNAWASIAMADNEAKHMD